jgi:cysteine-rich repeat protein
MDSITRNLSILCSIMLAAAITACAGPGATQCEATGVLCPSDMHCAAAQPICIANTNLCGNAHPDSGEECDDGNVMDGDGCSSLCKMEVCGNNRVDFGEQCDPPVKGLCAADCKREECGNGIVDAERGEECDDANKVDGDGCDNNCKITRCGNGEVTAGEVCDDGNVINGDGCDNNCTRSACGNGVNDPTEVCDDGNTVSGDGCSADCKSTEFCGNGIKDIHELCDDGNRIDGDGCDNSCQGGTGCGDGSIDKNGAGDPTEECDDGNAIDTDDCNQCHLTRCGDGVVQLTGSRIEQCDGTAELMISNLSGSPVETDHCNLDCTIARCGDGKVNPHNTTTPATAIGEQCDDGNSVNGDGCDNNCTITACGNKILDPGEQCDDGNLVDNDGCDHNCRIPRCGNGVVNPPEECDDGNPVNGDGCDTNCTITKCGNLIVDPGEECDDGNTTNGDTCDNNCKTPRCGNGALDPGEVCDDGNTINGDGCDNNCTITKCGNNITDPGEECDDGNTTNGDACDNNCKTPRCGNGALDPGEACDDGNTLNGDGCDNNCTITRCGNSIIDPGEDCDDGADNGTAQSMHNCSATCHSISCGNGVTELGEQCDDGKDAMGNNNNHAGARCNGGCQLNVCGDGDTFAGAEQCDAGFVDMAGAHPQDGVMMNGTVCDFDCTLAVCGDNHMNTFAHEQCDDGASNGTNASLNHCDSFCRTNACGNGIVDIGEQCDDGVNGVPTESRTCNRDCTIARCGDGKTNMAAGEACDNVDANGASLNGVPCDYGNPSCTRCNSTCTAMVSPGGQFCGDGIPESPFEQCDPATGPGTSPLARVDSATCDNDCTSVTCGDRHTNMLANEHCDDGNNDNCGGCNKDCLASVTPTAATGSITTTDATVNTIAVGDTFILDDGFGRLITFKFVLTVDPMPPPNEAQIAFHLGTDPITDPTADTAAMLAANIASVINKQGTFNIRASADPGSSLVVLTSTRLSSHGNTDIMRTGNISMMGSFSFANMRGGLSGDCDMGIGCKDNTDCTSGVCDNVGTMATHLCH